MAPAPFTCEPIHHILDQHARTAQRDATRTLVLIERPQKPGGVGDQMCSLLGAIAVAVSSGRRLEVAPLAWSYIAQGFELSLADSEYSAGAAPLAALEALAQRDPSDPAAEPFDRCLDLERPRRGGGGGAAPGGGGGGGGDSSAGTINASSASSSSAADEAARAKATLYRRYRTLGARHEPWAIGSFHCQNLAARRAVSNGYRGVLERRHELLSVGRAAVFRKIGPFGRASNAGASIFQKVFAAKLRELRPGAPLPFKWGYLSCALRHWLRPSAAAVAARERQRPTWPAALSSLPLVGIHVRAAGHLLSRDGGSNNGRYHAAALAANDAGLGAGCGGRAAAAARPHAASEFEEFWATAAEAEGSALHLAGAATTVAAAGREGAPVEHAIGARWLLVTDSASLKEAALRRFRGRLQATGVKPSHVLCQRIGSAHGSAAAHAAAPPGKGHGRAQQQGKQHHHQHHHRALNASVMETVAELLLLSEADVVVHAKSRFPLSALYLAPRCTQSLRIDVGETTAKCAAAAAATARPHAARRHAALLNQTCRPLTSTEGGVDGGGGGGVGVGVAASARGGWYTVTRELLTPGGDWDATAVSPP